MNLLRIVSNDLLHLFYPNLCCACGDSLPAGVKLICISCMVHMPQTNFHLDPANSMTKKFWGRIPILQAASYYYFQKNGRVQNLLHELKYKGRTEVGEFIGQLYGDTIKESNSILNKADIIVPIPLHYKKLRKRGYNQSDFFAKGLSHTMEIPWSDTLVQRQIHTNTQTGKNRIERWDNVNEIFELKNPKELEGKHILLVDDVVTTGATIEACANAILSKIECAISVVSIATAI